jgi:hypothetical protein
MKSLLSIGSVFIVLLLSGCGEDRSQGDVSELLSIKGGSADSIYGTSLGKVMDKNNFVYIPGGFDVDGDGVKEGGFWLSKYEAKEDHNQTEQGYRVNNVQMFLADNFKVFNKSDGKFNKFINSDSDFLSVPTSYIVGFKNTKVNFKESGKAINMISPLESVVALKNSKIPKGYDISLPSEKQWMQVVQLVINNPKNWTGEEVGLGKLYQGDKHVASDRRSFFIKNGILGTDPYIPKNYEVVVYDLSGGVSEWTSGMVAIEDRFLTGDSGRVEFSAINSAPFWWKPSIKEDKMLLGSIQGAGQYHDGYARAGTNDTLAITTEGSGDIDSYAVVARGGSNSIDDEVLVGIGAAKLGYGAGHKGPSIGFRAASDYLY